MHVVTRLPGVLLTVTLAGEVRWKCFWGILPNTSDSGRSTGVTSEALTIAVVVAGESAPAMEGGAVTTIRPSPIIETEAIVSYN